MARKHVEVHESAANIFAEFGLPDANVHFSKAEIVAELYQLSNELSLTKARPAH